jgi:hypothetical protein
MVKDHSGGVWASGQCGHALARWCDALTQRCCVTVVHCHEGRLYDGSTARSCTGTVVCGHCDATVRYYTVTVA